jgi:hypothetical protein
MTYQITASPIKGQKETKTVEGVRALHIALAEYNALGYEIKRISRPNKMLNLVRKLQVA